MSVFKKALSKHSFASAVLFVVLLYLFEEYLFEVPQARFLAFMIRFFSQSGIWIIFVSGVASFIVCCFFVQAALESSRSFQAFYVFLFTLALLVQYGFWKAVKRFMITADLKIAAATPVDTWKGAGVLFFDWQFILPVIAFVFWLLLFSNRQGLKASFIKFISLFLLIAVLNFCYSFTYLKLNLGLSLSSFYQTVTRFLIDNAFPSKREMINYSPIYAPQNNIVLVIDESIRGDHLSINGYERATTPFLDQFAETERGFYNIGLAASGATCSYASNALLLTGMRPGLDDFQKNGKYPTVFQYAKAMGYKTYYMDVQTDSLWNGLTDHDLPFIDSWLDAFDFENDFDGDFRAADKIVEIVSEEAGNFIVLNKRGVHFLYEDNYPSEAVVWPLPSTDYAGNPVLVLNPYDNGILYNVNTFFERLLVNPNILENTTILYTSDHGQTLFENYVNGPHCGYSLSEATVPMILIGRNLPPVDVKYHASHSNILPTLLDLMGVPLEQRMHPYAPSLFSVISNTPPERFFFDGNMQLRDFPNLYMDNFK